MHTMRCKLLLNGRTGRRFSEQFNKWIKVNFLLEGFVSISIERWLFILKWTALGLEKLLIWKIFSFQNNWMKWSLRWDLFWLTESRSCRKWTLLIIVSGTKKQWTRDNQRRLRLSLIRFFVWSPSGAPFLTWAQWKWLEFPNKETCITFM